MDKDRASLLRRRNWSEKLRQEENEAAAAAGKDPDLRKFLQQSEKFNARVHRELAEVPVPPTLRDQILARRKVVAGPWRGARLYLPLAAALLALAVGIFYWSSLPREDLTLAGFQQRMLGFAMREYSMDILTNDLGAVRTHLAERGAPAQFSLPAGLAALPVKGGKKLAWQDSPVGMVCFDWQGKDTLYMFVIDSAAAGAQAEAALQTGQFKTLATATWSNAGQTFLLAGHLPERELEALVRS